MQSIFQNAKRLISMCLVTLLLVTSAITILPAPARADNDFVIVKCESDCGNMAAFAAGVASGSAVTLVATGGGGTVATVAGVSEIAAIGEAAMTVVAPLAAVAAPAVAAAAPVVLPSPQQQQWDILDTARGKLFSKVRQSQNNVIIKVMVGWVYRGETQQKMDKWLGFGASTQPTTTTSKCFIRRRMSE
ncbi:hypothetical protein [Iningainema tapete]|uniref:Uncharacterized protein n=1 Tax=Iningainema tapete BLCC-T55 TaxID=2748662 RepID=A0A8J7C7N9_9CYAN|nr:hypothetical protein [Iningainema tapete]MBD2775919.1 hypothetical protein [Iningainema tapete BLCC-T55]